MRATRVRWSSLAASLVLVASVACSDAASELRGEAARFAGSSGEAGSDAFPPDPPPHHEVAPAVEQAARAQLADRFGGFWVDGAAMFIAVVGEPTEEDRAVLEPETQGLPHRFVAVDTPHSRLQQVVDVLPGTPLWEELSMAGVEVARNRVSVGVSRRSAVDGVRRELRQAYPDVEFLVEFMLPVQPAAG